MADQNVSEKAGEIISRVKRRTGLEAPAAADDDGRVGIVRGALRAFAEGKMDEFLDVMNEDVSWEAPTGKAFPGAGRFEGRDQVKQRYIEPIGRTYTSFGFTPDSFLDADEENSVVVIGRFVGEGVERAELDVPAVQLWEFKGNTAARICIFTDSHPFPKLISESDEREREEEERSQEEDGDEKSRSESDDRGEQPSNSADKGEQPSNSADKGAGGGEQPKNGGEPARQSAPDGEREGQPSDSGEGSARGERSSEEGAQSQPAEAG